MSWTIRRRLPVWGPEGGRLTVPFVERIGSFELARHRLSDYIQILRPLSRSPGWWVV